jgi:uncharacterized protein YyaL (SSP411 family)
MQAPEGGYYSSLDADSEGSEGQYYVWEKSTIKNLLTEEEFLLIEKYLGLNQPANFEHQWHFYLAAQPEPQTVETFASAKNKLLAAREKRVKPAVDTKILTAWNALMIKAMLVAGDTLNQPKYIESAHRALTFIKNNLWKNQRLLATQQDQLLAYLDDYAFLIDALITSLQVKWNTSELTWAIELTEVLLTYFSDPDAGGFYFTANDHETLLYRPKSFMDEAIPAGNAIAARNLLTLGYLLGETRYLEAGEKTLHAAWPLLTQYPAEQAEMLITLNESLNPPKMVVIRGKAADMEHWQDVYKQKENVVFAIADDEISLPGLLNLKKPQENACAYVCRGTQCEEVINLVENSRS